MGFEAETPLQFQCQGGHTSSTQVHDTSVIGEDSSFRPVRSASCGYMGSAERRYGGRTERSDLQQKPSENLASEGAPVPCMGEMVKFLRRRAEEQGHQLQKMRAELAGRLRMARTLHTENA